MASKSQTLTDYLKKCNDPTYSSKVIGGGVLFKKAQSKENWKKRTYYIKDDKKLLYFYYGGKAKPPLGMLDVSSALLAVGPSDNIKKSRAYKADAVSLTLSLANESSDSNTKHFVMETVSEAKKLALMLCYISKDSNIPVFAQMMDWPDLEEACGIINGTSTRMFSDIQHCSDVRQLEGEMTKYDDELEDFTHKLKLFQNVKAQNSKTKTYDETFEVLQANLLCPLVEQRLENLKKKKQEVHEKLLQTRSFEAGMEKARTEEVSRHKNDDNRKNQTDEKEKTSRRMPSRNSAGSVNSSASAASGDESQQQSPGQSSNGESGNKPLRIKSFRRLLSMSRNKSGEDSPKASQQKSSPTETSNSPIPPPPPPKKASSSDKANPNPASSVDRGMKELTLTDKPQSSENGQYQNRSLRKSLSPASPLTPQGLDTPTPSLGRPDRRLSSHSTSPSASTASLSPYTYTPRMNGIACSPNSTFAPPNFQQVEQPMERVMDEETQEYCSECLRTMKSFVPFDVATCSESSLISRHGLSEKLAERIMKKKILWIIHFTIREIEKIPDSDIIRGSYNIRGHNLDIVELAALYAVLPESFSRAVDPSSVKETWRRDIEYRLLEFLKCRREGSLTRDEMRHEAYMAPSGDKWLEHSPIETKLSHLSTLMHAIRADCDKEKISNNPQIYDKLHQMKEDIQSILKASGVSKGKSSKASNSSKPRHEFV